MLWADRDAPVGKLDVLQDGVWLPPRSVDNGSGPEWEYPHATPLVPVGTPWHDGDVAVDAVWGASIHWNFANEGIYASYSTELGNPMAWSTPTKLMNDGAWYPQVSGLAAGGTDREAGQLARFFLGGRSNFYIFFNR